MFCLILIKLEFSQYISVKVRSTTPQENRLSYSCNKTGGRTDRETEIMELKVAFITFRTRVIKTLGNINWIHFLKKNWAFTFHKMQETSWPDEYEIASEESGRFSELILCNKCMTWKHIEYINWYTYWVYQLVHIISKYTDWIPLQFLLWIQTKHLVELNFDS